MGLLDLIKNFKNNSGHEIRILLLGLDNAGKTTILKQLSTESVDNVTPTKGFNVKSVVACGDIRLNIWDLGGQRAIRPYWSNYFDQTDALIYVIDSSDRKRFDETNLELMDLLDEEKLSNVPVLVFANKQDIPTAATHAEVGKYLKLTDLRGRSWHIAACSALSGEGLKNGMDWLGEQIKDKRGGKDDAPKGKKKNKDYCFYFGESSCYLKICECEQEKCTQEDDSCSYSYWCDINGDYVETDIPVVDMNCPSLKENCLNKKYFNGYCYLYQSHNCDHDDEVEKKGQSRNLSESCQRWGQTCAKKWTRHFACRQFRKLCHDYTLPPRVGNITEELDDIRTYQAEEHGAHWERNMRSRCRRWQSQCTKHNNKKACAKVARRCDDFLTNDTMTRRDDSSSSEEGEDAIRVILNSIDSKGNKTESPTNGTTEAVNFMSLLEIVLS